MELLEMLAQASQSFDVSIQVTPKKQPDPVQVANATKNAMLVEALADLVKKMSPEDIGKIIGSIAGIAKMARIEKPFPSSGTVTSGGPEIIKKMIEGSTKPE